MVLVSYMSQAEFMKANLSKTKSMVMEDSLIIKPMFNTRGSGKMIKKMARES